MGRDGIAIRPEVAGNRTGLGGPQGQADRSAGCRNARRCRRDQTREDLLGAVGGRIVEPCQCLGQSEDLEQAQYVGRDGWVGEPGPGQRSLCTAFGTAHPTSGGLRTDCAFTGDQDPAQQVQPTGGTLLLDPPASPRAEITAATAANPNSSPYCATAATVSRARSAGSAVITNRSAMPIPRTRAVTAAAMSHKTLVCISYPQDCPGRPIVTCIVASELT